VDRLSGYAGPKALRHLLDAVMSVSADLDLASVLRRIVAAAVDLVDARFGALGVLDETKTELAEFLTVGFDDDTYQAIGDLPHGRGILGLLILDPKPLRLPDLREHPDSYGFPPNHPPMQSFLGVPIRIRNEVFGNLYLTDKTSAEVFSDVDEELVVALAGAAAVAIENARLHTRVSELALLEDRERIARDLHDTVIQRLFATGLSLQGAYRLTKRPEVADRIQSAVDDLDDTVKHIRTVIFGLEAGKTPGEGLRTRVMSLVREANGALGFAPGTTFGGPVDTVVEEAVAVELLATLREALSNVARHAGAGRVELAVEVEPEGTVVLRVSDNGRGIDDGARRGHGLANMAERAERLGGRCSVGAADGGGTLVEWRVPLKSP
jgi:signal transduction histidine kinase